MKIGNKNISEIDLIPIIEDVLDTKAWGFKLSYSNLREYHAGFYMRKIIYDSEWCRIKFAAYQRRSAPPDMHDLYIRYGRLHASNEDDLMTWRGEKCHCWHSVGSSHLFFLEGLSPAETVEQPRLPVFGDIVSDKYELGDFLPLVRESQIWMHYGVRLLELFDLRRPDLWDRYTKYLEEYYKLQGEHYRRKGISPLRNDPPLWKVC